MSASGADDGELITRWTRQIRARLRDAEPSRIRLGLRISFGFWIMLLVACSPGKNAQPALGLALLVTILLFELPQALVCVARGSFARIHVEATGSRVDVRGRELPGRLRVGVSVLGSGICFVAGCCLLAFGDALHSEQWAELAKVPLIWGGAQLLPLAPFKLGTLLGERIGEIAKVKQAVASSGVALAAVIRIGHRLEVPLLLVGCAWWLFSCARNLLDSIARARDASISAERTLTEIVDLVRDDEPGMALRKSRELLASARSASVRTRAWIAQAWAALGAGDAGTALEAMKQVPDNAADAHLLAAYFAVTLRNPPAIVLLEAAMRTGSRTRESIMLLADLYYREGKLTELRALLEAADLLDDAERSQIMQVLEAPVSERKSVRPGSLTTQRCNHAF